MKYIFAIVLSSLLLIVPTAYGSDLKIGVVNTEVVVQKSPLAISYNQTISKEFKPRQDALNAAQKKLQDDMDTLNYNSYSLSVEERNQLQATINAEKNDFNRMNTALQNDLVAAQRKYTQELMVKLNAIIEKIAKDYHYDMIQTSANILYLNSSVDITPQVIQLLK